MEGEGRHERGTDERDDGLARELAAEREEERVRHGFARRQDSALARAILTDADDPLAAANASMRDPSVAPAVVRAFEQDASLGNLTIPGAAGGLDGRTTPEVDEPHGWLEQPAERDMVTYPWSGDPGDEQPHHVETVRVLVIRDAEGGLLRHHGYPLEPNVLNLADGEYATVEEWASAAVPVPDEKPVVYAPFGTLTDDALQRLEELGIQVEEIGDGADTLGEQPDRHTDQEWDELSVRDTATDGTVRELRLLEGGAVDLTPARKCQVWIDLRFQYVSDHPYGSPDTLEEPRLRTISRLVEEFANMTVNNGFENIEGMAIASAVAHVLDKPGDPFPAAG